MKHSSSRAAQRLLTGFALLLALPMTSHALQPTAEATVVLDVADGRWLRLVLPGSLLNDEVIAGELTSGLTTTFAFMVDPRGGAPKGGARVEVRYHLWDEAFHCLAVGVDGTTQRRVLPSREALGEWWQGLRLRALDLGPRDGGTRPRQVRITLEVIPFSSKEEEDTQRWLGEALAREGRSPGRAGSGDEAGNPIAQVFNVLIATSIRRRAVTSYRWTLKVPGGASP